MATERLTAVSVVQLSFDTTRGWQTLFPNARQPQVHSLDRRVVPLGDASTKGFERKIAVCNNTLHRRFGGKALRVVAPEITLREVPEGLQTYVHMDVDRRDQGQYNELVDLLHGIPTAEVDPQRGEHPLFFALPPLPEAAPAEPRLRRLQADMAQLAHNGSLTVRQPRLQPRKLLFPAARLLAGYDARWQALD